MAHRTLFHTKPSHYSRRQFLKLSTQTAGVAMGAGTILTACGSQAGNNNSSSTTTITVMYKSNELSQQQISLFESQNPKIKVNYVQFDPIRLTSMISSGSPPDFVRTTGAAEIPNIILRGLALNLDPYFAKSKVLKPDDLEPINDVYRYDGHTFGKGARYGMAKDFSQDVMLWYNKKLFDQAGVPYPDSAQPLNYNDLLDLGKRLTVRSNNSISVYGLNAEWGVNVQGNLIQGVAQQGGQLYNNDLTKVSLTSPEVKRVVQWYVDWAQAHVGPSPLDPSATWDSTLFPADRVAMGMLGFWFGGILNTTGNIAEHTVLAPTPQFGTAHSSACMTGTGAWIPKGSAHPEEAWKFMEFFMAGKPAHDRAQSGWGLPSLKSLMSEVPQQTAAQKQFYQVQQEELKNLSILRYSPYITDAAFGSAFTAAIEPVMKNQTPLDSALKQLEGTINLLLQNGYSQVG